jgi:hypothetical protein
VGGKGTDVKKDERQRRISVWFLLTVLLALFVIGGAAALGVVPLGGTGELIGRKNTHG